MNYIKSNIKKPIYGTNFGNWSAQSSCLHCPTEIYHANLKNYLLKIEVLG